MSFDYYWPYLLGALFVVEWTTDLYVNDWLSGLLYYKNLIFEIRYRPGKMNSSDGISTVPVAVDAADQTYDPLRVLIHQTPSDEVLEFGSHEGLRRIRQN